MVRAHLDANIADPVRGLPGEATFSDRSVLVNGRLALTDIEIGNGTRAEIALWSRNLLNRQQVYLRSVAAQAATGPYGIFNEPRTFGADIQVRF